MVWDLSYHARVMGHKLTPKGKCVWCLGNLDSGVKDSLGRLWHAGCIENSNLDGIERRKLFPDER